MRTDSGLDDRSWSTQIDLMNRYPEYRFVASQAAQLNWLEMDYPLLFQEIKGKVASGQFHIIGGAWVECDTNMPSGEVSHHRSLLLFCQAVANISTSVGPLSPIPVCAEILQVEVWRVHAYFLVTDLASPSSTCCTDRAQLQAT